MQVVQQHDPAQENESARGNSAIARCRRAMRLDDEIAFREACDRLRARQLREYLSSGGSDESTEMEDEGDNE